jgi:hypothetical protein
MAVPSASGSGIVNKGTTYGATSQVTSTNINAHVDDAVFNANAVDGTTINADSNGKNLFVVDGSITAAKTSFLGTVDIAANSTTSILSKQTDGQYDSVTPSGDVTMTQAGVVTIANDAVTAAKTSFLGTLDVTADSTVRILSKQSDGEYDSVTPSGDVTMSQAGAFTIASAAVDNTMLADSSVTAAKIADSNVTTAKIADSNVTTAKIADSNVTLAKVANIADDRVLGNISG